MDKATRILHDMFEIIDDGTADLICRSDIYLADEIIRMHCKSDPKQSEP